MTRWCYPPEPRGFVRVDEVLHNLYPPHFQIYSFPRYDGVTPCIHTIDPDFIREVTVKQFDNFVDVVDMDFSPEQTTLDVSR